MTITFYSEDHKRKYEIHFCEQRGWSISNEKGQIIVIYNASLFDALDRYVKENF